MRLVFMVEERSMKELLTIVLPKVLPPEYEEPLILPHSGKRDLEKSIPIKLRAWTHPEDKFIILHDQDGCDCIELKTKLLSLCKDSKNDCLVRIVCDELEAWYFGDLTAVSNAYGKDLTPLSRKRKYRSPDDISNVKEELRKIVPDYQPIDGAKKISEKMDIRNNSSRSFNTFISGVMEMCACSL